MRETPMGEKPDDETNEIVTRDDLRELLDVLGEAARAVMGEAPYGVGSQLTDVIGDARARLENAWETYEPPFLGKLDELVEDKAGALVKRELLEVLEQAETDGMDIERLVRNEVSEQLRKAFNMQLWDNVRRLVREELSVNRGQLDARLELIRTLEYLAKAADNQISHDTSSEQDTVNHELSAAVNTTIRNLRAKWAKEPPAEAPREPVPPGSYRTVQLFVDVNESAWSELITGKLNDDQVAELFRELAAHSLVVGQIRTRRQVEADQERAYRQLANQRTGGRGGKVS